MWLSREELARLLEKNALNPSDIRLLDMLSEAGEIQKALRPTIQIGVICINRKKGRFQSS